MTGKQNSLSFVVNPSFNSLILFPFPPPSPFLLLLWNRKPGKYWRIFLRVPEGHMLSLEDEHLAETAIDAMVLAQGNEREQTNKKK